MGSAKRRKYLIRYYLIACMVLIQIMILIFFYNEYFNGKKLTQLEKQIQETRRLKTILEDSKDDILKAQINLQDYVHTNKDQFLGNYFLSLRALNLNLDSIESYRKENSTLDEIISSKIESFIKIPGLKKLIDSIAAVSGKEMPKSEPFKINFDNFNLEDSTRNVDVKVEQKLDTLPPKKLFGRLKDALKNDVAVKNKTTIITTNYTTRYGDTLNPAQMRLLVDSIVDIVNAHYVDVFKKYRAYNADIYSRYEGIYKSYHQLLTFSNKWMDLYNVAINDLGQNLDMQYAEQNSRTNTIRRYSVLGLMVLMLLVLAVIIYYNRQAFRYEKELQEANEIIRKNLNFKNRVLGMLSHDIRSPLRIINLFIDRIKKRNNDEQTAAYLESIKFTNNSLLLQANQVLAYARNEEKPIAVNYTSVDIKKEVDALLNAFLPYIEHHNNVFEWRNDILPGTIVLTDSVKLHQIFANILGNANKFTENGKITVTVATRPNNNYERLDVVISDTGIGISPSDMKKIFEPYYQGVISDDIENIGAGLGLNLCKEIIDKFGGEITVDSVLNEGTTVSFKINLERTK